MKTKTCIFAMLLAVGLASSHAQDTWTQKANFGGTARYGAVGFSIGTKGYLGVGNDGGSTFKSDFWEYDPLANTWTQKADFGGGPREHAGAFAIGNKGYVGTGAGADGLTKRDFWEYDPSTNIWTEKADFGGVSRYLAVGFSIGAKGYIGTGTTHGCCPLDCKKDVWEYDPTTNTWTQKADFGGGIRAFATGFSIGAKGYIGTGENNNLNLYKDFWEFDPVANTWSQKADFGGTARLVPVSFSIDGSGYIGTGFDGTVVRKDVWEYNSSVDSWIQKADFGGGARDWMVGFSIDGKGYVGTGGNELGTLYRGFWEYTPGDSGGSGDCIAPPPGLVSWWSGDKTADDVQGTFPGVLKNGASFTSAEVGPGFLFDGVDDAVLIPNSASLDQTRITIDAWVYPTGNAGLNRHVISKDQQFVSRQYVLALNDDDKFHAFVVTTNGQFNLAGSTTPALNSWYHLAMTHDGQTLRLYVDGVLNASMPAPGDIIPTKNSVIIGANGLGNVFKGIIDEAQIFSRALSDAEILAIYQAGADGQCKPEIFVSSITPSYEIVGHGFLISTSIVIQDENGSGIGDASVQLKTILPSGSVLAFPAKTDATGQATISFVSRDTGSYKFTVQKVSHPIRVYDSSLNIETSDTLVIP
jgi:N-acetylneuraminic acid mutarotase